MVNGNILPVLSLFLLHPLLPSHHTAVLAWLANTGWGAIIHYVEAVGGFSPIFTTSGLPLTSLKGNKLVISNHVCMTDGLAIFAVADRAGMLGNLKFFAKRVLFYTPFLGLAAYFLNFVFLTRQWDRDKHSLRKVFGDMVDHAEERKFWMVVFPEGTRMCSEKLEASQDFSRERGLPVMKHVMVPRSKGLVATLSALRGSVDAVVDVTLGYPGQSEQQGATVRPTLVDLFWRRRGPWPVQIHVHVIPIGDLPQDEEGVKEWLQERFEDKERMLEKMHKTGAFPSSKDAPAMPERPSGANVARTIALEMLGYSGAGVGVLSA
eukprot:CAMPEP_0173468412 /NCGR_PEP_ID=MMETSP1357-20121228/76774_1 /TAXON_ID=77926 /ORGANISM="Hemiselmis rufescens, Strain PCC563" /LENGTH=320 /DNA_ID=CAMNT_0014436621 /DNA_START=11 /DNA_END=970 /DNA_ORIENTATION=+